MIHAPAWQSLRLYPHFPFDTFHIQTFSHKKTHCVPSGPLIAFNTQNYHMQFTRTQRFHDWMNDCLSSRNPVDVCLPRTLAVTLTSLMTKQSNRDVTETRMHFNCSARDWRHKRSDNWRRFNLLPAGFRNGNFTFLYPNAGALGSAPIYVSWGVIFYEYQLRKYFSIKMSNIACCKTFFRENNLIIHNYIFGCWCLGSLPWLGTW